MDSKATRDNEVLGKTAKFYMSRHKRIIFEAEYIHAYQEFYRLIKSS